MHQYPLLCTSSQTQNHLSYCPRISVLRFFSGKSTHPRRDSHCSVAAPPPTTLHLLQYPCLSGQPRPENPAPFLRPPARSFPHIPPPSQWLPLLSSPASPHPLCHHRDSAQIISRSPPASEPLLFPLGPVNRYQAPRVCQALRSAPGP